MIPTPLAADTQADHDAEVEAPPIRPGGIRWRAIETILRSRRDPEQRRYLRRLQRGEVMS